MTRLTALDRIALIALIVGGINWGLVGGFDTNLITVLFGPSSPLSRALYVAIGVAALYMIYRFIGSGSQRA
jgi:uncharacterized membrane protein YuzA (DUF378 family)